MSSSQALYLEALNHLRKVISRIEEDSMKTQYEFYGCAPTKSASQREAGFEEYVKKCNDRLLSCNNLLRRNGVQLEVIDSEPRLIGIITKVREHEVEQDVLEFITDFWERLKTSLEQYLTLSNRIQSLVIEKLKRNHHAFSPPHSANKLVKTYGEEVVSHMSNIDAMVGSLQVLVKSFGHSLQQDLFVTSPFVERILLSCDLKAFPLLRVLPDVSEKFERACTLTRKWIDRDQKYVVQMGEFIAETRNAARERQTEIVTCKDRHRKLDKEVKAAHVLCRKNTNRLDELQEELLGLVQTEEVRRTEKVRASEDFNLKQSMADFLKISIKQTKKNNYSIQMQQRRLAQQLRQLQEAMQRIETELFAIEDDMDVKTQQKQIVQEKVMISQQQYDSVKGELDFFTDTLMKLQREMAGLHTDLADLEQHHMLKTSPEQVDDFFEKPAAVKLAPSLKAKIALRRDVSRSLSHLSDPSPSGRRAVSRSLIPGTPETLAVTRSVVLTQTNLRQRNRGVTPASVVGPIRKGRNRLPKPELPPPGKKPAPEKKEKPAPEKTVVTKAPEKTVVPKPPGRKKRVLAIEAPPPRPAASRKAKASSPPPVRKLRYSPPPNKKKVKASSPVAIKRIQPSPTPRQSLPPPRVVSKLRLPVIREPLKMSKQSVDVEAAHSLPQAKVKPAIRQPSPPIGNKPGKVPEKWATRRKLPKSVAKPPATKPGRKVEEPSPALDLARPQKTRQSGGGGVNGKQVRKQQQAEALDLAKARQQPLRSRKPPRPAGKSDPLPQIPRKRQSIVQGEDSGIDTGSSDEASSASRKPEARKPKAKTPGSQAKQSNAKGAKVQPTDRKAIRPSGGGFFMTAIDE